MMTIDPMWAMAICCQTTRPNAIQAAPNAMLRLGPDFAQNHVNTLLMFNPLSMVKSTGLTLLHAQSRLNHECHIRMNRPVQVS